MASPLYQIPGTPRVISPSPTLSEIGSEKGGYFTRSKAKGTVDPIAEQNQDVIEEEQQDEVVEEDPELSRARSRSRSPQLERRISAGVTGKMNGIAAVRAKDGLPPSAGAVQAKPRKRKSMVEPSKPIVNDASARPKENGFLSPASADPLGFGSSYWRNLSRSPSPLGLIPIHREWRAFVHKHEIPRKVLHVSIGFYTLWAYYNGIQISAVHPVLLSALVPVFAVDVVRFRWPAFNRVYIRTMGAFMREAEAHDRYNGVIGYLAGLWVTMRFCSKDVAVMSVLLLSWCDTAASTFGRAFGRYTPRIRKGKSLAGSIAAFTFGVGIAAGFWGWVAPATGHAYDTGINAFAYQGFLTLPKVLREPLGLSIKQATIQGPAALGMVSIASGFIASVSEAIDIFGLDDNLTIPVLCGIGIGGFLWAFGGT
ncbi:hypothetical protein K431DRAFT_288975 [Polychaeton citri CBS 116435]|uniref:Phosphatidate cytidylyltransferase n=1 Tax=Polychaeton citri CBS 116435 TaxID=1314669 RepID=A0A9P4UK13_9PEZI|nr:hypothetical protein K431DRAFT_288975 [Polychaeton citri CBS 116435]